MKKQAEIQWPFNNHIMFAKVMENQKVCKEFIQRLFADRKVDDVKIREVATLTSEATIIPGLYSKAIRMDVLFGDDESWYDIEMQVAREEDLPKRGRYYSAALDVAHLGKGKHYENLKQSFIIFLCRFDYYEKDEAIYTFERFDKKLQLPCGDESYIIILNTKCSEEKVPEELHTLFHYINTEEVAEGDWFVEMIHELVIRYQSDEEVQQLMTLEEEYLRKSEIAVARSHAEGAAEMRERLNRLNDLLIESGRLDDLKISLKDEEFQQQLLEEFGLA